MKRIAAVLLTMALAAASPAWGQGACPPGGPVVAIDIGHDRVHFGATSATGRTELSYNQVLAGRLKAALAATGIVTVPTTSAAADPVPLTERPRAAAAGGATLFLSLHHDAVQERYLSSWTIGGRTFSYSDRFHGYSLFVSGKSARFDASLAFAQQLGRALHAHGLTPSLHHAEPIPGENRPLLDPALGIYRFDDLVVLKAATMPAVLLEAGIIVNRDEERELAAPARQQATVAAITEAIAAWCGR